MTTGKDWTSNSVSYSKTLGASSHSSTERQAEDYYATEPLAVRLLFNLETFSNNVRECACGEGHLSKEMVDMGFNVYSSDIIDRGYGLTLDFLSVLNNEIVDMDIVTNPPYKYTSQFIKKGLSLIKDGRKLALFLPIRYLEGKGRKVIFQTTPPKVVYVSSSRIKCAMNGEFSKMKGSAVSYAWFVWEKGYKGETILKRFN